MSNPIPPLVSSTPPPIDFDTTNESYDDIGGYDALDISYNHYPDEPSLPSTPRDILKTPDSNLDLPTVDEQPIDTVDYKLNDDIENEEFNEKHKEIEEKCEVRNESPPSLILVQSDDFEEELEENFTKVTNKYGDDESVLSLKLDPIQLSSSSSPGFSENVQPENNTNINSQIIETENVLNNGNTDDELFDDDDDDEFDDFRNYTNQPSDIPNKEITENNDDLNKIEAISNDDFHFEADFSQFETFQSIENNESNNVNTENIDTTKLPSANDENEFKAIEEENNINDNNDDDDDFGDFNDFTQAQSPSVSNANEFSYNLINQKSVLELSEINSVLDSLFPKNTICENDENNLIINNSVLETDSILDNLRDLESTLALNYQWLNSSSNKNLIKSLGIDSRNILHGGSWNNSMPRFAANLGLGTLEPLKPIVTPLPSTSEPVHNMPTVSNSTISEVPAAQFDWNSAGLVNPLDGKKESIDEKSIAQDHTSRIEIDQNAINSNSSTSNTNTKDSQLICEPPIKTDLDIQIEHSINSTNILPQTSSYNSGNLRETHIFTPNKGINSVSRDVSEKTTLDDSEFSEFQSSEIKINKNVITKEYHDVEYNFPKDLDKNVDILQPTILNWSQLNPENNSNIVNNGNINQQDNDDSEFTEFQGTNTIKYEPNDDESIDINNTKFLSSPINNPINLNNIEFSKPSIGVSPTMENKSSHQSTIIKDDFDDEFTEFQYVEPIPNTHKINEIPGNINIYDNKLPQSNFNIIENPINYTQEFQYENANPNPNLNNNNNNNNNNNHNSFIPIMPMTKVNDLESNDILRPTTSNTINSGNLKSNIWTDPGFDSEEIARFEAAFSYANKSNIDDVNKKQDIQLNSNKDDEEWSDFVSSTIVEQSSIEINSTKPISTISNQVKTDDYWSDFVYSTPVSTIQLPKINDNKNSFDPSQQNGPNFTSWNTPQYPNQLYSYSSNNSNSSNSGNTWQQGNVNVLPKSHFISSNMKMFNNSSSSPTHNNGLILNPLSNGSLDFINPSGGGMVDINNLSNNNYNLLSNNNNNKQVSVNNSKKLNSHIRTPNIALIPDLGFAAPKPFINISKTNLTNSKK